MDEVLSERAAALATDLQARGETLATAESCTGGWLAKVCVDLAGSSAWFERGLVTYSNASKQELLGVPAATLAQYGAVSEQTVQAMAAGLLRNSHAQWGVAISGVAGPGGGTRDKPVGTVWLAWVGPDGWMISRRYCFDGDRTRVRAQAVDTALTVLSERMRTLP